MEQINSIRTLSGVEAFELQIKEGNIDPVLAAHILKAYKKKSAQLAKSKSDIARENQKKAASKRKDKGRKHFFELLAEYGINVSKKTTANALHNALNEIERDKKKIPDVKTIRHYISQK